MSFDFFLIHQRFKFSYIKISDNFNHHRKNNLKFFAWLKLKFLEFKLRNVYLPGMNYRIQWVHLEDLKLAAKNQTKTRKERRKQAKSHPRFQRENPYCL
jgi:hypothetical protein